jgi:hypothetical protein
MPDTPSVPEPEQLLETISAFIQAKTWDEKRRIVEQHPELLTDEADALLGQLITAAQEQGNENTRQLVEQHRTLLHRCREMGTAQAFREKNGAAADDIPEELRPLLEAIAALPEEQRNALLELFAGANAPDELLAALEDAPELGAILAQTFASSLFLPGRGTEGEKNFSEEAELTSILQELSQPAHRGDMPRRIALCQKALGMIPRQAQPELWVALQNH